MKKQTKTEIKPQVKTFLDLNGNENTIYPNLWDRMLAILIGESISPGNYTKTLERSQLPCITREYFSCSGWRQMETHYKIFFFCLSISDVLIFLFHFIYLITFHYYPLEACLFSKERSTLDLHGQGGRKELRRVEKGKTIIRIYYVKPIFNF